MNEHAAAKAWVKSMLDIATSGEKLVTVKEITKSIKKLGKDFANQVSEIFWEEVYNRVVGDVFELFAEYFFKTCSAAGQYGIVNYEPANNPNDWGVDGYGIASDRRESVGGPTPAVVQVKFRSNPMDAICYTCLAKTGWDGVKYYNLDVKRNNNVILFCNTEDGANYLARQAIGTNLYVIKKSDLDKDQTGIKTVTFWEGFYNSIP
jgi:hypothetical protein